MVCMCMLSSYNQHMEIPARVFQDKGETEVVALLLHILPWWSPFLVLALLLMRWVYHVTFPHTWYAKAKYSYMVCFMI